MLSKSRPRTLAESLRTWDEEALTESAPRPARPGSAAAPGPGGAGRPLDQRILDRLGAGPARRLAAGGRRGAGRAARPELDRRRGRAARPPAVQRGREPYAIFGPARWSGATTTGCTWSARSGRPSSPTRAGSRHRPPGRFRRPRSTGPSPSAVRRPGPCWSGCCGRRRARFARPTGWSPPPRPDPRWRSCSPGSCCGPSTPTPCSSPARCPGSCAVGGSPPNPCPANPRRSPDAGATPP